MRGTRRVEKLIQRLRDDGLAALVTGRDSDRVMRLSDRIRVMRSRRLGYLHVGESHRGHLRTGTVDLYPVSAALDEVGYSGTISFESFSLAVVVTVLSNTLAVRPDRWRDCVDPARHAHAFVTERLPVTTSA